MIIYFDNIQNESGVVSTNAKITDDKQEVDFNITLNKPGDYYEFDVDTVNDGIIDAMIDFAEFGELDDSVNAYGIYITNGEVTLGVDENPEVVSTTSPIVSAIGTTSGIGVKKLDGIFNYYDGIITGLLEAKPEAPTDIPTRYRVIFNNDANNYQNCILEYVP